MSHVPRGSLRFALALCNTPRDIAVFLVKIIGGQNAAKPMKHRAHHHLFDVTDVLPDRQLRGGDASKNGVRDFVLDLAGLGFVLQELDKNQ